MPPKENKPEEGAAVSQQMAEGACSAALGGRGGRGAGLGWAGWWWCGERVAAREVVSQPCKVAATVPCPPEVSSRCLADFLFDMTSST